MCRKIIFPISAASHSWRASVALIIKDLLHNSVLGFSDPIYAEAYVKMQGFDILLGILLSYATWLLLTISRCPPRQPNSKHSPKSLPRLRYLGRSQDRRTSISEHDRTSWFPKYKGYYKSILNRDRRHLREYSVGRTKSFRVLRHFEWHSHWHHGLYQTRLLQRITGTFFFFPCMIDRDCWTADYSSEVCGRNSNGRTELMSTTPCRTFLLDLQ